MSHLHRFYQPEAPSSSGHVTLSPEESHHALRVLRVRVGDAVELFDGCGHAWSGTVGALSRTEVDVEISGEEFTPRERPGLTLAQAWLHRDKVIDDLVRDVTVLGVEGICFFRASHSEKAPKVSAKWTRLMIESCKQCGRRWLPELTVAASVAEVLRQSEGACIAVAAMDGPHAPLSAIGRERPVVYFVGPEGDFSADEMSALREAGALPLTLGNYTLRAEAAATVGVTLLQYQLGNLG
jgi:16S rRNA (uracil1498-N3)-methyltransferase